MPDINAPYPYFANPSKGVPLANGYIYIGLPDLDPTIPANQVTITARQEDGSNVAVVQPIRTNAGGLPTYNGAVVQLQNLVTVVYSIQVLDANMVPIYYQAQAYGIPSLGSGGTPTALTLLDGTAAMPSLAFLNNLDTGLYYVAPNQLHFSIDGQDTVSIRTDVTDSELRITSPDASATTEYFGDSIADAFRVGLAGGLSLLMDDNASRNFIIGTNSTERLRITDLGSITSGGLATATVQPGGLDLQQSGTGFIQGWRSTAVSTGITGTGAPDAMYGWVQPIDAGGGLNLSGARGDLVGLVMTGYASLQSTGVQTAPVMVDARLLGGGSIAPGNNVFGVSNNGTPIFAVLGDGSISPNPVDSIDDLLIGGAFATGGAALNAVASTSGGITVAQDTVTDGFAFVAQAADIAHGMTTFAPTDVFAYMGAAELDGGLAFGALGGTGTAFKIDAIASTANTGFINDGVYTLYASKADGILNQALLPTETLLTIYNGNSIVYSMLGDGSTNMAGGLTVNGAFTADSTTYVSSLSEQIIHTNPSTVQPFTAISTDPDVFGIIRSNLTVNGGYRVLGFAASTTAAYRVDAYTAAPASGFGLDSPIRFTGYKSNGGTGSTTIADAENVFSVWNQSSNCLLNITGNGNQTIAGSVVTGGSALPVGANTGSLSVYTGTQDSIAQYWLNDDVAHGVTAIAPTNCYGAISKTQYGSSALGGLRIDGLTEGSISIQLVGTGTAPATTVGSGGVLDFLAQKKSGTGVVPIASTEIGWTFSTDLSTSANRVVSILGNGDLRTAGGLATGGETAPDSSPGGITILSTGSLAQTYKAPAVAHGMTSLVQTNTYGSGGPLSTTDGALQFQGYGSGSYGIYLRGTSSIASTSTAVAPVVLAASVKSGTSSTNVAAGDTAILFRNITNHIANFKGNGDFHTAGGIATGGETAPDVVPGGLCIFSGTTSGYYQTIKNSSVNVPFTAVTQSDTFAGFGQLNAGVGGLRCWGFSEGQFARMVSGVSVTAATNLTSSGVVSVRADKSDGGTGITSLANNESVFTVQNGPTVVEITKGNGDKYLDGGLAVGGGTDLLDAYVEDTWTVNLYDAASGGNVSATSVTGHYTRVGNVVTCTFNSLNNIDTTGMTGTNDLYFSLPIPATSVSAAAFSVGTCTLVSFTYPAGRTQVNPATVGASSSRARIIASGSGVSAPALTVGSITSGVSDIVRLSITYFVD